MKLGDERVKKLLSILMSLCALFLLMACAKNEESIRIETERQETGDQTSNTILESGEIGMRQISVKWNDKHVIYELNDSPISTSLMEQLPLTVEIENYSTNEKIFYPPEKLDTRDSPLAKGGIGTLAYYEPWGDVVFFYGDYRENSSLFELGKVVSGEEMICEMSGTLTIDFVQES